MLHGSETILVVEDEEMFGHDQVDDEKIRPFPVQLVDGLLAVCRFEHCVPIALEHSAQQPAYLFIVIDHQNGPYGGYGIQNLPYLGVKGFWINANPGSKTP